MRRAVIQEAKDAGVYVFGGGIDESVPPVMVDGLWAVREGTYPQAAQFEGRYSVLELQRQGFGGCGASTASLPLRPRRPENTHIYRCDANHVCLDFL